MTRPHPVLVQLGTNEFISTDKTKYAKNTKKTSLLHSPATGCFATAATDGARSVDSTLLFNTVHVT